LLIVAKDAQSHLSLCEQFASRTITRRYVALVSGAPAPAGGRVCTGIARKPSDRKRMAVAELHRSGARLAASNYATLEPLCGGGASLVEWKLETGRTHQIRVHSQHIGHPILGDDAYGGTRKHALGALERAAGARGRVAGERACAQLDRPALHARVLGFQHPVTGERILLEREPPSDFQAALEHLRQCSIDDS